LSEEPIYWGSWKGRVVKAISIDGARTWDDIRNQTGLSHTSMKKVFSELFDEEVLIKIETEAPAIYRVVPEVYHAYREYIDQIEEDVRIDSVEIAPESQRSLASAIGEWKDWKRLNFSMKKDHFYLTGTDLVELSSELIKRAQREVLIATPFVEACALSDVVREAATSKKVIVVLRKPDDSVEKYRLEKERYIQTLSEAGAKVVSNTRVHAKVIVLDRAVAIVSSMNLNKTSTSGSSWEAGLISKDDEVVEEIANSILQMVEIQDSKKLG
jgi:phosphatidylserine/phosphatidylglycerophosphate/cardiolipin synthase-like enzyme